MKITLANGYIMDCENVCGARMMYQGVNRDSLTMVFDPDTISLDQISQLFTAENCQALTITDDQNNQFVHENYTIRAGMGVSVLDLAVQGATNALFAPAITKEEPKAWVTMVETTLGERQLQEQQELIDQMLVSQLME